MGGRIAGSVSLVAAIVCLSLIACSPCLAAGEESRPPLSPLNKKVLVLHSYYQGYRWTDDENEGIESVLRPIVGRNNIYIEYMDTKKVFGALYEKRLRAVYEIKYKNIKFDLIVATDNNAFEFLRKNRDSLFPKTPVVFCGVNDVTKQKLKGLKYFTGVNEAGDYKKCIELMLRLHPKTKQIVFVNEWTTTGMSVHEAFLEAIEGMDESIKFMMLEDVDIDYLLSALRSLEEGSLVLYTSFGRDSSGKIFEYDEIAKMICSQSKVPVYTPYLFNIGHDVVGGLVLHGQDQGVAAGNLGARILRGEKAEHIPVVMSSPKRYVFDYRSLDKFRIDPGVLPPGSVIVNAPQTLYFRYRNWINSLAIFIAVLIGIISILLINIRKRRQAHAELSASREQLRELTRRLAQSEDKERKTICRELHDQIGQSLTLIGVNLNILRSVMPKETAEAAQEHINDSIVLVKQTVERTRALMDNLRSPVLDDYGLVAALELYGQKCATRGGLKVFVRGENMDGRLPGEIENAMFRIVQEALTNVVKYALATEVDIDVGVVDKKLKLSVSDNGIGFEAAKFSTPAADRGWGLVTMAERARAVGGHVNVESAMGRGTRVTVEVPL
ncbi:MAG: hypothetical protein HGB17_07730 [Syntrophobacteraceae bacterium]|nr:hypothetical protein [Syntrophobacteraceae bacterium]